jgi:radical SAM superfamily enzyme YgiQ (UPF0313 family)
VNKKSAFPPLGILTVSSMLPADWEKRLVDMNVKNLKDEDIDWADMVFISGMIVQKDSAQKIIDRVKTFGKTVIAGGPLFTTGYKDFRNVDSFVLNEGETTLPLFLEDLEKGIMKPVYSSNERPDIGNTPLPDWNLINVKDYLNLAVQFSRGCPFNCEFCDIIVMNGRIPRTKTTEQMMAEFDAIYAKGWKGGVFIVDDNFIGNKNKVKDLLTGIKLWMEEKKYPFTLFTEASINLADDEELMVLMREANFDNVFIGIETPDEDALKSCDKVQNQNINMIESIKRIQRNGMGVMGGFIVGFDTDTPKIFDKMVQFIQKSGVITAMVGLLNALPKTKLHERLSNEGRLLENQSSGNNTDSSINFLPKMNIDELIKGYKGILEQLFTPKNYYKRITTFLKEYNPFVKGKKSHISIWKSLRILTVSIFRFGFIDSGRFYFWKMFIWALVKKPYLLADVISYSITGFHYRKVLIESFTD